MIKLLFVILFFGNINTICVEVIDSPDTYMIGKVFEIPLDSTQYGYHLSMWCDIQYDTLYNQSCTNCLLVQINPINCEN